MESKPIYVYPSVSSETVDCGVMDMERKVFHKGMTLRDYFAGLAMQGHLASEYGAGVQCTKEDKLMLAGAFYEMADAMLKQREL